MIIISYPHPQKQPNIAYSKGSQFHAQMMISIPFDYYFVQLKRMNNRMMLPIELTKILYDNWQGQISTSSQDSEIYGKCLNGPGKVTFKNGNRYEGDFYNGLLNGKGKFIWANGIVYEGEFTDNRITGQGTYKWPDGSTYEGEVKDGLRHGTGKYCIDDATYQGEWLQGKKHGKGKIVFKSGSIFEGNFKNDMKEGYGKMYYYPSGNFFEGEWKQDQKSGMGTMNWSDIRQKYVGNWSNNQQEGWGIHIWLQSKGEGKYLRNRYEGNWKVGVRDGFGVFYYANGSKYEGYWKDNMKEGYAFYTDQNGKNSLILFSKDRMMKGEKPSQIQGDNAKKASKKEVEPNYYGLCLSVDHFFLPLTPNLEPLYNYLLRNNTQLKSWYKGAAAFYDQQSEFSFCLTLEGAWKMIRSLKILGDFSLAHFNRGLPHSNPDIEGLLKITPQSPEERVNYEDIYYRHLGAQARNESDLNKIKDSKHVRQDAPFREYSVHNREENILFREFVHLLVWMAHHIDPSFDKPQKSTEKLMAKITPFLESISKTLKAAGSENMSQNKSSISKAEKNLTPFYRNANTEVFKALLSPSKHSASRRDETIRVRELLGYGLINACIGEAEWGLLEKIMQKYFDNDVLNRQKTQLFGSSKIPLKVLNVLNYELIEYEFIEIIYILFIKKLPSTKQTDQNKKKYQQTLNDLFAAAKTHQDLTAEQKEFKDQLRYVHSAKSQKRKDLQARRRIMEERKAKAEAAAREREQEEQQRQLMQREDVDIKDVQFQEEPSEFQI